MTTCPLCSSELVSRRSTVSRERIVSSWQASFGYNIAPDLEDCGSFSLYRCRACGLDFFSPLIAGGADMYSHLSRFPWYYEADKWEHDEAIKDLCRCPTVLEIGSGKGEFVAKLQAAGVRPLGLEMNPAAVTQAEHRGRPVRAAMLDEIKEQFDAVCAFQVLEHVPEPQSFIGQMIERLKPGGLLALAVPNNDSYIKHEKNPINEPPHHITRWNPRALESLARLFPLSLVRLAYEPMPASRFHLVADAYCSALPQLPGFIGAAYRLSRAALPVACALGLPRFWRGHSVYACFRLIES